MCVITVCIYILHISCINLFFTLLIKGSAKSKFTVNNMHSIDQRYYTVINTPVILLFTQYKKYLYGSVGYNDKI